MIAESDTKLSISNKLILLPPLVVLLVLIFAKLWLWVSLPVEVGERNYRRTGSTGGQSMGIPSYRMCHDFRRSRLLSLFGRRSAVDVTGFLAIAAPFFIDLFVLSCFAHLVCISQPHCMHLFLCSPSCLCVILLVLRVMFDAPDWCSYYSVFCHVVCLFV